MSRTYAEVIQEIESLKAEAERIKQAEVEGVIARIKDAIAVYGLTPADLGFGAKRGRKQAPQRRKGRAKRAAKARAGSAAAKFRDAAGNTWGGRGPRPRWLREALASGKSLQDFAV